MPSLLLLRSLHSSRPYKRVFASISSSANYATMAKLSWAAAPYPPARRSDHVDVYKSAAKGEVRVHDPYQWLEEYTEETNKWIAAQEAFTRSHLDKNPDRKRLEDAIRASMDYAKFSSPILYDDNRWYWHYNSGLQQQSVIYRSRRSTLPNFEYIETEEDAGEIFFDANLLSDDGTASLVSSDISRCGKYFAYGISYSGSDFSTIYIRPTNAPLAPHASKNHHDDRLADEIRFVKFSAMTWTPDSKGFFYQRYPERSAMKGDNPSIETQGDVNAMVYYHRIGTPQSDDILVHKDPKHPEWMYSMDVTEDGRYLIMYTMKDSARKNLLWVAELEKNNIGTDIQWIKLFDDFDAEYELIANDGSMFYIRTNKDAPQYKVMTVTISDDIKVAELDMIPEDKNAYLASITCFNQDKFAVVYKRNVKDEVYLYSNIGQQLTRLAPDFVGAATVHGRQKQSWVFVTMTGFNTPGTVARYDFKASEAKRWSIYRSVNVKGLNPKDFEAIQVWYESRDGTKIPMFIVRHKDTPFDGTAPALQYGYGGFSIPVNPFFSSTMLTFLKNYGAILAVPNIRGGGEFGETWHKAGCREKKFNCFDDFIAATKYLGEHKYANPKKIAINGGSNGGLLVAACVNRAPEGTFGAAVAEVGVLDMLKFSEFTIGRAWISDYGDPQNSKDFDFIYKISPLHNIPTGRVLPPTLLLTADHDDRVVPMHSFKHAATLQYNLAHNPNPLLLRVDVKAGHGAGKSTEKRIQESADKLSFIAQSLDLAWKSDI